VNVQGLKEYNLLLHINYQIIATSDATKVFVVAFSSSVYARTRFNSHQSLMSVTVFVPFFIHCHSFFTAGDLVSY
jgi:hypothetical protein